LLQINKIYNTDCKEGMKLLSDNLISSIVTDPPYGLSKEPDIVKVLTNWLNNEEYIHNSKGFMNKDWDLFVPNPSIWKEAYRVLKPGGYLLCFAGTRTYDLMCISLRLAGFEIRDQIDWIFGCYSDDTECLTKNGFKRYNQINNNDEILQWNFKTNELTWHNPDKIFVYNYNGEMTTFKNRHTDQLLTPNHRVYAKIRKHSRNEIPKEYEIIEASDMKKHWQKDFSVAGILNEGKHIDYPYLIGWWLTDAWTHNDGKACMFSQSKYSTLDKLQKHFNDIDVKYSEYINKYSNEKHKDEHVFYVTGKYADYLLNNFPNRDITWDMLSWDYESRFQLLEGLLDGDGSRDESRGYSEVFWSLKPERLDIFQAICCSLNIRSHIDYNKGCVYLNREHNSTQLQSMHYTENKQYKGKVWCLETQTGAFVVRRNGKVFISGNSGFPKSMDISKQIDKKFGVKREETGEFKTRHGGGIKSDKIQQLKPEIKQTPITTPSTNEAKQFNGYGTNLKPAHEPIIVARKPLSEKTVAKNVVKYGTGEININDCRVEYIENDDPRIGKNYQHNAKAGLEIGNNKDNSSGKKQQLHNNQGRFPANIIMDEEAGKILDSQSGIRPSGKANGNAEVGIATNGQGVPPLRRGKLISRDDTGGASRFFKQCNYDDSDYEVINFMYCAKASKKERGEGNNHPCVKPLSLIKYLVTLVTPPNGICLDPFEGSGTTFIACQELGFDHIGFEMNKEYCDIAEKRLNNNKGI